LIWVLAVSAVTTLVVARRRGWKLALVRQAAAWLPAAPLAVPGLLAALGQGMVDLYRLLALGVILWCQAAMLSPGGKAAPPGQITRLDTIRWLLGAVAAPLVLGMLSVRHYLLFRYPGLGTPDDSLLFYAAKRLSEGGVLYRDVHYPSGPGLPYLLALLYRLAGPSLPLGKWLLALCQVAGVWAAYGLGQMVTSTPVAFLVALLVLVLPMPLGLTLAMLAIASAFARGWRREAAWGLAGLLNGLALLCDPALGLAAVYALVLMVGVRQLGAVRRRLGGPGVDLGLDWPTLRWYVGLLLVVLLSAATALRTSGAWGFMLADWRAHPWGTLEPATISTVAVLPLLGQPASWAGVLAASARLDTISAMLFGLVTTAILLVRLSARQWREQDFLTLTLLIAAGVLTLRPVPGAGFLAPIYLLGGYLVGWAAGNLWQALLQGGRVRALLRAQVAALVLVVATWPLLYRCCGGQTAWSRPAPQELRPLHLGSLTGGLQAPAAEADAVRALAHRVQQETHYRDRILVLPCAPALYFVIHRTAATRLAAPAPWDLDQAAVASLRRAVASGSAKALVIDTQGPGDSLQALEPLPALTGRLAPAGQFGRYQLWLARG